MNLSGKDSVSLVDGNGTLRATRVCSRRFNIALRTRGATLALFDTETGATLTPSKGIDWAGVAVLVRAGKKAVVKVEGKVSKPRTRKSKTTSLYGLEPEGENV